MKNYHTKPIKKLEQATTERKVRDRFELNLNSQKLRLIMF